mgnify:CR=1 FL=1
MTSKGKVTVLGINGHIGQHAARAFVAAGWEVSGFGRSNKQPIEGVRFIRGDAENVAEMAAAVADAEVVVNALNLPYDKWDNGRMEAQTTRVIEAMGRSGGKTMVFPGNIYNYAASQRHVTPQTPQNPQTPRGAIRVQVEAMLRQAAERGDMQVLIVRAGDFYAPNNGFDYFDQAILREAGKNRVAIPGSPQTGHSWAYLPDLGRAFEKVASERADLSNFENFHFAGHFVTHGQLVAAVQAAAPVPLKVVPFPWTMLKLVGIAMPLMREVVKMRYLWDNTMELEDPRLDAILGPDFATPFDEAISAVVAPFFADRRQAA